MMSTDTRLKRASTLRSIAVNDGPSLDGDAKGDATALRRRATEDGRESRGSPPMDYVQRSHRRAPIVFSQNLHSKGFGGGVPLNTERAAVKPRVGIG
jgi:hypothetical protein